MNPHAFVPDKPRTTCQLCGHGRDHSLHIAYEDVDPPTDGAQAYTMIRGTKP